MRNNIKFSRRVTETDSDHTHLHTLEDSHSHYSHEVNIKPKPFLPEDREKEFFKKADDKLISRGIGDKADVELRKKSTIHQEINKVISSVTLEETEIDLRLSVPVRTGGAGGRLFDATQFVKKLVTEEGGRAVTTRTAKKSSKKKQGRKQSREQLFLQLKRKTQTIKSATLTSELIKETFQKTSLWELRSVKQRKKEQNEGVNSINSQKKDESIEDRHPKEESKEHFSHKQSKSGLDKLKESRQLQDKQSHQPSFDQKKETSKAPSRPKRLKPKNKYSEYVEEEAEESGDDVNMSSESQEEDNQDLIDLIDNHVQINEDDEALAQQKIMEIDAKRDEVIIQKILKGEFYKKKPLAQMEIVPSERIKEMRRDQMKSIIQKDIEEDQQKRMDVRGAKQEGKHSEDILGGRATVDYERWGEKEYEEEKNIFFQNLHQDQHNKKQPLRKGVPHLLIKKKRTSCQGEGWQDNVKRSSVIKPTHIFTSSKTALSNWISLNKGFLQEEETDTSADPTNS